MFDFNSNVFYLIYISPNYVFGPELRKMNIPRCCEFYIPEVFEISSLCEGLPMSEVFRENMTEENWKLEPFENILLGGLHCVGKSFKYEDILNTIEHYAIHDDRKFRLGTLAEFFVFSKQNASICPEYFVIFDILNGGGVPYHDGTYSRFDIAELSTLWCLYYQVFIVEEVDRSLARH